MMSLLLSLITGCSLYRTNPSSCPAIISPEPIWVLDIDIKYDSSQKLYYMDRQSMQNLDLYLIDVHRYVKNVNSIINDRNKNEK